MLDLELLNFWIKKYGLYIEENTLFIRLSLNKSHKIIHTIKVSDDKHSILDFFGYDTRIEYDELTQKNTFVFLSTSSKLNTDFIDYYKTHFKGGHEGYHPKNKQQREYNEYLLAQDYDIRYKKEDLKDELKKWQNEVINTFRLEDEYKECLMKNQKLSRAFENLEKCNFKDSNWKYIQRFILFYGINTLVSYSEDEFVSAWEKFKKDNWSSLDYFLSDDFMFTVFDNK